MPRRPGRFRAGLAARSPLASTLAFAFSLVLGLSAAARAAEPPPRAPADLVGRTGCASWLDGRGFDLLTPRAGVRKCERLCTADYGDLAGDAACYRGRRQLAVRVDPGGPPEPPEPPVEPPTEPPGPPTEPPLPTPNVKDSRFVPAGYDLVFADEFKSLNLREYDPYTWEQGQGGWLDFWWKWAVRTLPNNGDLGVKIHDDMIYTQNDDPKRVGDVLRDSGFGRGPYLHHVKGGKLWLRAYELPPEQRHHNWGLPYVASMISAEGWFAHRYGYWEMRLRVPKIGKGHHLALWLLPEGPEWPPEFDLLELVNGDGLFHFNAHPEQPGQPINSVKINNGERKWQIVGLEWTPDKIVWTINGKTMREQPNYVFDKKMFPLISWEIAGHWPGQPDNTTPWPAEAQIDYIRVYQR